MVLEMVHLPEDVQQLAEFSAKSRKIKRARRGAVPVGTDTILKLAGVFTHCLSGDFVTVQ